MNWLQGTPRTVKPRSAYRSCRRSRPAYCGVRPHFEATLTMSTALPRYWPRSADPPRRPPISTSKTDMGPILGDVAPPRPAPCWLDRPAGTGRAPGPAPAPPRHVPKAFTNAASWLPASPSWLNALLTTLAASVGELSR